jgi:Tol biopolymer transport system component
VVAHAAAWSPDGRQIAFIRAHTLYLLPSEGGEPKKLAALAEGGGSLRWSPNSRVLRFTGLNLMTDSGGIWEVSADGTNLHRVAIDLNDPPAECCGNWTADGKYFIFISSAKNTQGVWALREKGGIFQKPSQRPFELNRGPLIASELIPSPDGKRVFLLLEQDRGELVKYDSRVREFVPYLSGISAEHVSFSKDGQWVAYVDYPQLNLWRSRADGSERLQLTSPPLDALLPSWSPDGKTIAFLGQTPGKPFKIYLVSADGGSARQLLPDEQGDGHPSWSPDGNTLAFAYSPSPTTGDLTGTGIRLMDLKTNKVSELKGPGGIVAPQWSPDGRYLAAVSAKSSKPMLFDFKTRQWTELAGLSSELPVWSRHGKYVYFVSRTEKRVAVVRVRVSDRKVEQVLDLKGFHQEWGDQGPWFGLAFDDSPLLLRSVGSADIYALDWEAP